MPALPSSLLDPIREQFLTLVDLAQPAGIDTHPLDCHRPRIDDGLVFDHLIEVLVYGAGYERIADATCSATTMRRRRDEWARAGLMDQLRMIALAWGHLPLAGNYDRMIGLDLADVAIDGCIRRSPLRGADGRAQPRRPRQGRPQTPPAVRRRRHPHRGDPRPSQPA